MSLPDGIIEDLTAALEQERDVYSTMLDLAGREERAIVRGDVAALTALTDEKEQLLELLAALEAERMTAITAIATAAGQDPSSATLSSLVVHLPADAAVALTSAGVELRRRAIEVRDANDRNARLLRSSRDIVDRWLQYLRTLMTGALYDGSGRAADIERRAGLDRSA